MELSFDLDVGISRVEVRVVVLIELAKSQPDWRTTYDQWKFKESILK